MNDLNQHFTDADFEDEEFDENPFDAEFRRREDEEGRGVDAYLDEEDKQ
jgi:hypothetical protein